MAIAFVFPGQGSQAVGMGAELAKAHAGARAVFDEVDAALGQKLSEIMFNGPLETLTLTENAQPALMAVSLAVMRVLEARRASALPARVTVCRRPFAWRIFGAGRGRRLSLGGCGASPEDPRAGHADGRAGRARRHGGPAGRRQGRRARSWRPRPRRAKCASSPTTTSRPRPSFPAPRAPSTAPPSSPRRTACAASCRSTSAHRSIAR